MKDDLVFIVAFHWASKATVLDSSGMSTRRNHDRNFCRGHDTRSGTGKVLLRLFHGEAPSRIQGREVSGERDAF